LTREESFIDILGQVLKDRLATCRAVLEAGNLEEQIIFVIGNQRRLGFYGSNNNNVASVRVEGSDALLQMLEEIKKCEEACTGCADII